VDRDILERRIILVLRTIRDTLGCSLHEALDVFVIRYEELRRDRPMTSQSRAKRTARASTREGCSSAITRAWPPPFPTPSALIPSAVGPHVCGAGVVPGVQVERATVRTTWTPGAASARLAPDRWQAG
jgi:hypothetical protein